MRLFDLTYPYWYLRYKWYTFRLWWAVKYGTDAEIVDAVVLFVGAAVEAKGFKKV